MAVCRNCGVSLNEGAKFCSSCGAPTGNARPIRVSGGDVAESGAPAAAKPDMTPATKVLIAILCALVLVALLGVGGLFYAGYHMHKKAQEISQMAGDPNALLNQIAKAVPDSGPSSLLSPGAQPTANPQPGGPAQQNPAAMTLAPRHVSKEDGQCALFAKEELTQVLVDTLTHADPDATGCTYKGDLARQWVRTEILWTGGKAALRQRKDAYASLARNMPKANIPIQPYPDAGDEAFVNLWNSVQARKGDIAVTLDLRYYHDNDAITRMLVNAALSRLANPESDSAATPNQAAQ